MKRITVIIVNWNGKRFLSECLNALRNQTCQDFSIILADNGSEDGSADFVSQNFPEVRLIRLSHNTGFAVANNIALKQVDTEYAALLNNDAVAEKTWLETLVHALDTHADVGFAASKMLFYDAPQIIDRVGDAYSDAGTGLLRGRGMPAASYDVPDRIFGACAGAALYRMSMLNEIGVFDEDFFLLYEDVDLSFRAQLSGYQCLYVPKAVVYHKASATIVHDSATSVYFSHRNLEWAYLKNMPASLIAKTLILHLIYDIAACCYFAVIGKGKIFIKAKADALKGLKTMLKKRRQIQKARKVSDDYIQCLLEKETFLPRLLRRFQKYRKG